MSTKVVAVLLVACFGLCGAAGAQDLGMGGLEQGAGAADEVAGLRAQVAELQAEVLALRKAGAAATTSCGSKAELQSELRERAWAVAFNDIDGGTTGIEFESALVTSPKTHLIGSPSVEVVVTYRRDQWGSYYRIDEQGNYLYDSNGARQTVEKKAKVTVRKTVKVKLTEQEYAALSK